MKKYVFTVLNILIPLIVGAVIYYLFSPEVVFVKTIDTITGMGFHFEAGKSIFFMLIRNYILDMLWAYALMFALVFFIGNGTEDLIRTLLVAVAFSIFMEFLQWLPFVRGTFDIWDMVVEVIAEVLAVFVIKKLWEVLRDET